MRIISCIDPHVHLRGEEYAEIPYFDWAFDDAKAVGLCAMFEMPNPKPFLTDEKAIMERFKKSNSRFDGIFHGVNIGLTNDLEQVNRALTTNVPGIVADKIFYTHSTGNMGILDEDIQKEIWRLKGELRYKGVSIGHFEDEKAYVGSFDYNKPISHSLCQNCQAELIQIERQFKWAVDFGFRGTFYVAHVSNPLSINFLTEEKKKERSFKIVVEATFHHMFLNYTDYDIHKNRVKMNPPLRSPDRQQQILGHVLAGNVDIIGTDHAPHPVDRKDSDKPPSGIPAIPFWPKGIELLSRAGASAELIGNITFHNANRVFCAGSLPKREVDVEYDPKLWDKYGWNSFSRVDHD